jgi:hypothetical protein
MDVFVPYTQVHLPTWLGLAGVHPVGVEVDGESAYLDYFRDRWADRRPFVNVEHDMLVTVDQVRQLENCEQPWCAFGYDGGVGQFPWLGCARFRPELMELLPSVWDELHGWVHAPASDPVWRLVGDVPIKGPPPGEFSISEWRPVWRHLDRWLIHAAARASDDNHRVAAHRHFPDVHNCRDELAAP